MSDTHTGNMLNEMTREEHDGALNAKRVNVVSGTITASSQVTVQPLSAWPDPKAYIGLVTITGSLSPAAGNVTLDAGSKTQIIGNITLSDPKGFIGLVTIVGSLSPAAGNVTLDAGSRTGLVGTVTIQDGGNSITVDGNVGVIGNVTVQAVDLDIRNLASATDSVAIGSGNVTVQAVDLDIRNLSSAQDNVAIVGNVTLSDPKGFIGLVTVVGSLSPAAGNVTLDDGSLTGIVGNVTLSDSKGYIGLVTATVGNNPVLGAGVNNIGFASVTPVIAWPDPKTYIGLVTITGSLSPAAGNVTLDDGSLTGLIGTVTIQDGGNSITIDGNVGVLGNVTLSDSKGFIGLVTIGGGLSNVNVLGNVTLTDSKGFIGLVTTVNSRLPILGSGSTISGYLSTASGFPQLVAPMFGSGNRWAETGDGIGQVAVMGNVTLTDAKTFIGLVTLGGGPVNITGNVTVEQGDDPWNVAVKGNVTLSDSKTFIGLTTTTLGASPAFIGIVTIANTNVRSIVGNVTVQAVDLDIRNLSSAQDNIAIIGNVTLSDSKGFIGLVTTVPTFVALYTSLSTVISATGVTTVVIPPAGQKVFVRSLHVSSLGRSEISSWTMNGSTSINRVPWTSLSTTSGINPYFGENGRQWGEADQGLSFHLNGAATVGIMVDVRFA